MTRPPVTAQETMEAILAKSQRSRAVPFRRSFVQDGKAGTGPLANLVTRHEERALDLYMLAMTAASHEPWKVTLPAAVWSRALGWGESQAGRVGVSRAWGVLLGLGLISRSRQGRMAEITILKEDGRGDPYVHPGSRRSDYYFQVSLEYWRLGWHLQMDLVTKAMLLIALSREDNFSLPAEKAPDWYGISADSVERGLANLRHLKLLKAERQWRKEPLSPTGWTQRYHYQLEPPFGASSVRLSKRRNQARALKVVS